MQIQQTSSLWQWLRAARPRVGWLAACSWLQAATSDTLLLLPVASPLSPPPPSSDGRSLLANLRPQPQDPNSAHALGHTHTPDGVDRAPQGGYVPKRAKNTREQREGKEGNDKPNHKEDTHKNTREQREGKEGNDKPYHREDTPTRDGPNHNHNDGYGSEHIVYTGRNQRNRVKPGRNGKPARNGRDGSKGERDHYGHDDKKSLPAAQGESCCCSSGWRQHASCNLHCMCDCHRHRDLPLAKTLNCRLCALPAVCDPLQAPLPLQLSQLPSRPSPSSPPL